MLSREHETLAEELGEKAAAQKRTLHDVKGLGMEISTLGAGIASSACTRNYNPLYPYITCIIPLKGTLCRKLAEAE